MDHAGPGSGRRLGEVSAPSGVLLIIDMGALNLWSHDREPKIPEGVLSSIEATEQANAAVDLAIEGPDAEAAGKALDRQWNPLFVYDMPPAGLEGEHDVRARFERVAGGLRASLRVLPERVTHRERVDEAIAYGAGAGEVQYHGMGAAAISGVPRDRALPVLGERAL